MKWKILIAHRIRAAGGQLEASAEDEGLCGGNDTGISPGALRPRAAADRTIASVLVAGSHSRALNMRDSATVTVGLWMYVCAEEASAEYTRHALQI